MDVPHIWHSRRFHGELGGRRERSQQNLANEKYHFADQLVPNTNTNTNTCGVDVLHIWEGRRKVTKTLWIKNATWLTNWCCLGWSFVRKSHIVIQPFRGQPFESDGQSCSQWVLGEFNLFEREDSVNTTCQSRSLSVWLTFSWQTNTKYRKWAHKYKCKILNNENQCRCG